jgi:hypothetical protein
MKFLLTNNAGSFLLLGPSTDSRYDGAFFWVDNKMYRTLVSFDLKEDIGTSAFDFRKLTRTRNKLKESFFFADRKNILRYELSEKSSFDLILDCKENFDNREWGRFYKITKEKDVIFIHFKKRDDVHEKRGGEFELWLAFYSPGLRFSKIDKWEQQHYAHDESRQSQPYGRYVYRAGTLTCSKVDLGVAKTKEGALALAKAFKIQKSAPLVCKLDTDVRRAYHCAANSLLSLRADDGLFAGLPWFHQRWLRDEVISAKALMQVDEKLAKQIVFFWLDKMDDYTGTFPGTLSAKIADGTWVFFRLLELLENNKLTKKEQGIVKSKLESFFKNINIIGGLVANGVGETWMDAVYGADTRMGARVEINALALATCKLAEKLGMPYEFESRLKKEIVDQLWNGSYLNDGRTDQTMRPNVFIAAYVYPELLPKAKWLKCFDAALSKLWLPWGGLTTISKKSKLYCDTHTGEDPKSYHRGDSWFWINNLAALVLHRFDKKKYERHIKKILQASTDEILSNGALGHHAELSSAKELGSEGCLAQAWSDAMFMELVNELRLV